MKQQTTTGVSAGLFELADLLDLAGRETELAAACRVAGRALRGRGKSVMASLLAGDWKRLPPSAGAARGVLEILLRGGRLGLLEELRGELPRGLVDLLSAPRMTAAQLRALYVSRGVESWEQLEFLAGETFFPRLPGGGEKTADALTRGLVARRHRQGVFLRDEALALAQEIERRLAARAGVLRVALTGALRRSEPCVTTLEFVVAGNETPVVEALGPGRSLRSTAGVLRFASEGEPNLLFRIVPIESFASALVATSCDHAHFEALRTVARDQGYELRLSGLCHPGHRSLRKRVGAGQGLLPLALPGGVAPQAGEETFYRLLGLSFIPAELREGAGIIECAARGELVRQPGADEIRGVLGVYTRESVGRESPEDMVREAARRGYRWVGISDQISERAAVGVLGASELDDQRVRLREAGEKAGTEVLLGAEVEVLVDGSLGVDEEVLEELDFVVGSVRRGFHLSAKVQTARLIRAIEHPSLAILGQPTGRILPSWQGIRCAWDEVLARAAERSVALEVNLHPLRMDPETAVQREMLAAGGMLALGASARCADDLERPRDALPWVRKAHVRTQDLLNAMAADAIRGRRW